MVRRSSRFLDSGVKELPFTPPGPGDQPVSKTFLFDWVHLRFFVMTLIRNDYTLGTPAAFLKGSS